MQISKGAEFEPIDEGVYEAHITKIEDHIWLNRFEGPENVEGLRLTFTIAEEPYKDRHVLLNVTPSITPKSKLKKVSQAVVGREFTPEELAGITDTADLYDYLGGKPLKIIIKNKADKNGKIWYNVTDFVKSKNTDTVDFEVGQSQEAANALGTSQGLPATTGKEEGEDPDFPPPDETQAKS